MATRGRKAIEVSEQQLTEAIRMVESAQTDGKFPNRSQLWIAVENTEWAKQCNPRPLTAQVAMNLAKEFGIEISTPVGKRGREKGQGPVRTSGPRTRKGIPADIVDELKKEFDKSMEKTVIKASKGSLKAAIKLKCLDCCGNVRKEVALCTVTGCSLFSFRPYKHKESLTKEGRNRISLGVIQGVDDDESDNDGTDV